MSGTEWSDPRPLSPHVQVWKWHATMAASIFHRVSGAALYFGSFLIALWVFALAMPAGADGAPPALYASLDAVMASLPGQILLTLWAAAVLFHLANGIRYLVWSGPRAGFNPATASAVSVFNIAFAIFGAVAIWAAASLL